MKSKKESTPFILELTPQQMDDLAEQSRALDLSQQSNDSNLDDKRRSFVFNLRLTEREMAALNVIPVTTPESKHAFCIRLLREKLGVS